MARLKPLLSRCGNPARAVRVFFSTQRNFRLVARFSQDDMMRVHFLRVVTAPEAWFGRARRVVISNKLGFLQGRGTMAKLMHTRSLTLARVLVLCSPALLLAACAAPPPPPPPPPCDACALAHQALATANEALSTAQAAMAKANAMYQRGLRK
jgi:hypothetical protein